MIDRLMLLRRDFLKSLIACPVVMPSLPLALLLKEGGTAVPELLSIVVHGPRNEFVDMLLGLHLQGVESIDTVFLDGVDAEDERFAGHVTIRKHLGGTQSAAYLYVRLRWSPTLFPNGVPRITSDWRACS